MARPRKIKPTQVGHQFDEKTLDRLVQDALRDYTKMRDEIADEGETIETDNGFKVNPKIQVMERARTFVKLAWSTKFRESEKKKKDNGEPENHFDEVDLS